VKVGANVPVFVLEYLLGKYCATDDPTAYSGPRKLDHQLSYSGGQERGKR
jgi:predicted ATP-dependent Lon-type protease